MSKNKNGIRLMFAISFIVLVVSSVASYVSISKLNDSGEWVRHTTEVIEKLDLIVSKMKDAETGYRGFLLTGNEVFLEPYTGSKTQVMNAVGDAELLTRDNSSQQNTFPRLKSLIDEKYNLAEGWISLRKQGKIISITEMLRGKEVMDSIRKVTAEMKHREALLMKTRAQRNEKFILYTPISIMAGALIAVVLTIFFYLRLKRNLAKNEQLHAELQRIQKNRASQIETIDTIAKKIASGDYNARIDLNDLGDKGEGN